MATKKTNDKGKASQKEILTFLDSLYDKSLSGIPNVSKSVEDLANEYLCKYKTKEEACKALQKNQIIKCTTSGVLTGFGGLITLPVAVPANVGSVLYVQMRMIACTAYMGGYDLKCDQTQTFVYACLAGVSINQIVKQFGIKFGNKFAVNLIKKIPGKVLTKINQKVGFRFITKFGEKGLINLGKLVPGVGAVISGGLDYSETKVIARRAYKWFINGDFENEKEDVIEPDISESDYIDANEIEPSDYTDINAPDSGEDNDLNS